MYICMFVCMSACLFVVLYVCLTLCLSAWMFVCVFVCVRVCMCVSITSNVVSTLIRRILWILLSASAGSWVGREATCTAWVTTSWMWEPSFISSHPSAWVRINQIRNSITNIGEDKQNYIIYFALPRGHWYSRIPIYRTPIWVLLYI